jgi:putative endonuclease
MKHGFVYIMTDKDNEKFYVGVTNDIKRRVLEHKAGEGGDYTRLNRIKKLVYFERLEGMFKAIKREKLIKKWRRSYKINIIRSMNPAFEDLAGEWAP